MLKSYGWDGGVGGPCDFSVSPSPFGLVFGTSDLGLTKIMYNKLRCVSSFFNKQAIPATLVGQTEPKVLVVRDPTPVWIISQSDVQV